MNEIFADLLSVFIVIYSDNLLEHKKYIKEVL